MFDRSRRDPRAPSSAQTPGAAVPGRHMLIAPPPAAAAAAPGKHTLTASEPRETQPGRSDGQHDESSLRGFGAHGGGDASRVVQARAGGGGPGASSPPPAPTGGGTSMPADVRAKMEAAFATDFSSVRIHEGAHAPAVGALAYTQGTDIHFAPGQYQPHGQRGQELLGHELAHVVQQAQGRVQATRQAKGVAINDDRALEQEADEMGARAARGEAVARSASGRADSSRPGGDAIQRTELDARTYVLKNMGKFTQYGVNTHAGNWLILLLKQMWDAYDPEFESVFLELIRGLNIRPGQSTDGYDPATLWDVYTALSEAIGEQHTRGLFAKHQVLFLTANDLLKHFKPSSDVQFPHFKTLYKHGPRWDGRGADKEGIGVLAMVPTHPGGKHPDSIVSTYKGGFSKKEAARRLGMSIGINAFAGIGTKPETSQNTVTEIGAATSDDSIPLSLVKFTWKRGWESAEGGAVTNEYLLKLSSYMGESEKNIVQQAEKTPVPHGSLRETILKADSTGKVKENLQARPFIAEVYYHIADDDSPNVKTPKGSGVYTEYQKEIRKRKDETGETPSLLAGGYRVRREDNEKDKGDIPSNVPGTELSEIASDLDHALRDAIAKFDPRIPYLSEANLLVKASDLDTKVSSKDDPDGFTGAIFGKESFESGNLKRFMDLNGLDPATAKKKMGYVHDASLVTGTKGGGSRFYEYRFRKPENYLSAMEDRSPGEEGHMSWEDVKTSAYKNAISTSQNIGSLGNLAINLSLYFTNTKGYTVSTGTIAEIMKGMVQGANIDPSLSRALLDESGFKNASKSKQDAYPDEAAQYVRTVIEKTFAAVLPIHVQAYEQVTDLLYDYIQSHAKKTKQAK